MHYYRFITTITTWWSCYKTSFFSSTAYGSFADMSSDEESSDSSSSVWPGQWTICYWCSNRFWEGFYTRGSREYVDGHALCNDCSWWLRRGGTPYWPDAQTRLVFALFFFGPPNLDEETTMLIVEFAYGWWEP